MLPTLDRRTALAATAASLVPGFGLADPIPRWQTDSLAYLATLAPRPPAVQTEADLAKVTAPTLLLWSEEDSERPPHPDTDDAMAALAATDKSVVIIPQCEHMMPLDCGPESAVAAKAFFDRVSAAK